MILGPLSACFCVLFLSLNYLELGEGYNLLGSFESQYNHQGQAFLEERIVFIKARRKCFMCLGKRILYGGKNEHDRENNRGKFRVESRKDSRCAEELDLILWTLWFSK